MGLAGNGIAPRVVLDDGNSLLDGKALTAESAHHEPARLGQCQDGPKAPFFAKR